MNVGYIMLLTSAGGSGHLQVQDTFLRRKEFLYLEIRN